ncbi:MAG: protein translocase subunit SecDF, partial [Candidatus Cryptobacteroides sp.]
MQSKGAIRLVAILLAAACLWQLSFTLVSKIQENRAEKYAQKSVDAYENSAAFLKVADADKAYCLDSIRKESSRWYLDSISSEKVYLGYTYKSVKEKEINLGLDLKGGMNVMLQVQLEDLVKALSDNNQTPEFKAAIALAKERSVNSREDFISLFETAWKEVGGGTPLAQVFGTYEMRDKVKPESTDAQVIDVIRKEAESAISNSFNVLRNRIDRFGVTQPSIQQLGNSGRILVELPGVKEPERVRKLLQGTASLEFWATYENSEIFPFLQEANSVLAQLLAAEEADNAAPAEDTDAQKDILSEEISNNEDDAKAEEAYRKANPLFSVLQPAIFNGRVSKGACIGYANYSDTAKINK